MKRFFMFLGTSGDLPLLIAILLFLAVSAFASPAKASEERPYLDTKYQASIVGCYDNHVYRQMMDSAKSIYGTNVYIKADNNGIFLPYVYTYYLGESGTKIYLNDDDKIIFIPYTSNCIFMFSERDD